MDMASVLRARNTSPVIASAYGGVRVPVGPEGPQPMSKADVCNVEPLPLDPWGDPTRWVVPLVEPRELARPTKTVSPADRAERRRLAVNLRRLMADSGMTTVDLVKWSGVDERTIRGVLRGTAKPHARTIHRLARALQVDAAKLLDDDSHAAAVRQRLETFVAQRPHLFAGWSPLDVRKLLAASGA